MAITSSRAQTTQQLFSISDRNYSLDITRWCDYYWGPEDPNCSKEFRITTDSSPGETISTSDALYIASAPISEFKGIPKFYIGLIKGIVADRFPNLTCDASLFSKDASVFTDKIR